MTGREDFPLMERIPSTLDAGAITEMVHGRIEPALVHFHESVDQLRAYGEYWSGLFEAARQAGQLRAELDLFTTRMLVLGALNWTAEWFDPQRGDAAAVATEAAALVLHGVAVGPGASTVRA